eukprot:GHVU01158761.1.p1 GENE.GHVU01158761.1~~GHVU01158761.1.p1  ORF type:complete len:467 (+),score=108.95 GHVU01158761.1:944-2344(+)
MFNRRRILGFQCHTFIHVLALQCHCMSEQHQRMMKVFTERPKKFMDEFSRDFEFSFMQLMRTRYCRTKILANTVYCDMISDKQHIHMNSTLWVTLSEFVSYLGESKQCTVEWTEKGPMVEYIDREKMEREKKLDARRRADMSAEEGLDLHLKQVMEEAKKNGTYREPEFTPLMKKEGEVISFKFGVSGSAVAKAPTAATAARDTPAADGDGTGGAVGESASSSSPSSSSAEANGGTVEETVKGTEEGGGSVTAKDNADGSGPPIADLSKVDDGDSSQVKTRVDAMTHHDDDDGKSVAASLMGAPTGRGPAALTATPTGTGNVGSAAGAAKPKQKPVNVLAALDKQAATAKTASGTRSIKFGLNGSGGTSSSSGGGNSSMSMSSNVRAMLQQRQLQQQQQSGQKMFPFGAAANSAAAASSSSRTGSGFSPPSRPAALTALGSGAKRKPSALERLRSDIEIKKRRVAQ